MSEHGHPSRSRSERPPGNGPSDHAGGVIDRPDIEASGDGFTPRILVVDDEVRIRQGCQDALTRLGYQVACVSNGPDGLQLLEAEHYDIVLLDLMMPEMSGFDVLSQIRSKHTDTVVIVITGYATLEHSIEAMKKGAFDFIPKPFTSEQLRVVVGKAIDYTRALQDIATEQSRIRVLINRLSDGVLATDRKGRIILANPAFRALLGISGQVTHGRTVEEVIPFASLRDLVAETLAMAPSEFTELTAEVELDQVQNPPESQPRTGQTAPVPQEEASASPGSGEAAAPAQADAATAEPKILAARCFPFRDRMDRTLGSITVLHDISALKRSDQLKSDFVSMVSHEIRSPMSAVLMQLNVLQDGLAGEINPKQREVLDRASQRIKSLVDLASDLLDLAKIESGLIAQEREKLDPAAVIQDQISLHQAMADQKHINIALDIRDPVSPVIFNRKNLEEIFSNLITNALKYTPEGGSVTVSAEQVDSEVCVSVTDTGYGIPEDEQPLVFRRFYRVKSPQTRMITGTGLGLPIVRQILDAHHGSISLESTPGQGSTFRVYLPTSA